MVVKEKKWGVLKVIIKRRHALFKEQVPLISPSFWSRKKQDQ